MIERIKKKTIKRIIYIYKKENYFNQYAFGTSNR